MLLGYANIIHESFSQHGQQQEVLNSVTSNFRPFGAGGVSAGILTSPVGIDENLMNAWMFRGYPTAGELGVGSTSRFEKATHLEFALLLDVQSICHHLDWLLYGPCVLAESQRFYV